MDKQLYILGAGRHPLTKRLRATRNHQRRTFYIGELHITSNKRLPISIGWASLYFETIVKHIRDGTVLLHFAHDRFVDPEELRILCFGTTEEIAAYNKEASTPQSIEPSEQPFVPELPEATEVSPGPEPVPGPSAEELEKVHERGDEPPMELEEEPLPPPEQSEEPLAEEDIPEMVPEAPVAVEQPEQPEEALVVEQPPVAEEAPVEPVTEEAVPDSVAAVKLELPEDWRKRSKTTLLGYAETLGLDVSAMPSNKQLISMIERAKGA